MRRRKMLVVYVTLLSLSGQYLICFLSQKASTVPQNTQIIPVPPQVSLLPSFLPSFNSCLIYFLGQC